MKQLHEQLGKLSHLSNLQLEAASTAPLDPFKGKPTIRGSLSTQMGLTEARVRQIARTLDFKVDGEFGLSRKRQGIPLPGRPEVKATLSLVFTPQNKPESSWLRVDVTNAHELSPQTNPQIEIKGDEELPAALRERVINLLIALRGRKK